MKTTKAEPCDFCDGRLRRKAVQVVRGRGRKLVVIEEVPARVCDRCGIRYYDAEAVRGMEEILKRRGKMKRTIKVPVTTFEGVA